MYNTIDQRFDLNEPVELVIHEFFSFSAIIAGDKIVLFIIGESVVRYTRFVKSWRYNTIISGFLKLHAIGFFISLFIFNTISDETM